MRRLQKSAFLAAVCMALSLPVAAAQPPLTVHEWGTLTTRHTPSGEALGRLNRIDASDVLPEFVHRFEPPQARADPFGKSPVTPGRPDVTMRLETPVIYFYGSGGQVFDLRVQMRGGILNEFYPQAAASVVHDTGRLQAKMAAKVLGPTDPINLDNYLLGTLDWNRITLDATARAPQTNAAIWTAPRNVSASRLAVGGEGEHYLFYRGVAHLDALLSTRHSPTMVWLSGPSNVHWLPDESMTIPRVWLVDVRAGGQLAFATRVNLVVAKNAPSRELVEIPAGKWQHAPAQTAALRQSMKSELVRGGLYDDEAEAMLAAWNVSYFQKPGLRVFYMVPRQWLAYFLPLELSVPHEATRVFIGRIDLAER